MILKLNNLATKSNKPNKPMKKTFMHRLEGRQKLTI